MITIGFFSSNTWIAKIIEWFEGSPISHSAIGFEKDGKKYWLHAAGAGVQIVDRDWLGGLYAEFQVLPDISNEVATAEKKVGEPYAVLTLLGFIVVLLARRFGIWANNPFPEKSAVVCSEFVIEVDINHLIKEFIGVVPSDITPKDLFDICSKGNSFKKIT